MPVASQPIAWKDHSDLDGKLFFCVFKDGSQRVVVSDNEDIEGAAFVISLAECSQMHDALLKARAILLNAGSVALVEKSGG